MRSKFQDVHGAKLFSRIALFEKNIYGNYFLSFDILRGEP